MKILVIDDDASIRRVAVFALAKAGHEVVAAAGGEEGVALAASAAPDLILLDLMMPGIDGMETRRRLKADACTRDIPVVFLSADSVREGEPFLPKPFNPLALAGQVAEFLKPPAQ